MSEAIEKICIECGSRFKGRMDKKFCSDQCRSSHNNKLNSVDTNYMRKVNYILRKNRRILIHFNPRGKTRVTREKLNSKGFDFNYFTGMYITKEGAQYYYCYDQGYLPMENGQYLLVIRKKLT